MRDGSVVSDGDTSAVVGEYLLNQGTQRATEKTWRLGEGPGNEYVQMIQCAISQDEMASTSTVFMEKPFTISVTYTVAKPSEEVNFSIYLYASDGELILHATSVLIRGLLGKVGTHTCDYVIPAYVLNQGDYYLSVASDIPFKVVNYKEENILLFSALVATP